MRVTLAGTALVVVLLALGLAAVVGVGHGPLPTEVDALLVEVRTDDAGQPLVEVEAAGDGALRPFGVRDGTLLVRPDQFLCEGGSLSALRPGLPVEVLRPEPVVTSGAEDPVVTANLAVIDCGA